MAQVVVTGTFEIVWETDECRALWDVGLSDEDILLECVKSVDDNWQEYAVTADMIHVEGHLVK